MKLQLKDLMIGDWVYIKDYPMKSQPQKVKPEHFVRSLVEFEPIPLTAEILEKNGFRKRPYPNIEKHHQWIFCAEWCTITLWCRRLFDNANEGWMIDINNVSCNSCIRIKYLHELQHALKLCKIEKSIEL